MREDESINGHVVPEEVAVACDPNTSELLNGAFMKAFGYEIPVATVGCPDRTTQSLGDMLRESVYEVVAANLYDQPDFYVIKAVIPGASDISLTWKNGCLTISGKVPSDPYADALDSDVNEIISGDFERRFFFGHAVDIDSTKPEYIDGVLFVTIMKSAQYKDKTIVVK